MAVTVKRLKFAILLALVAAGCMTADDKSAASTNCPAQDTVRIKDSIIINRVDTVRIYDTVLVPAVPASSSDSIFGIWKAKFKGVPYFVSVDSAFEATIAIIPGDSLLFTASFTGTRKEGRDATINIQGNIGFIKNGLVNVEWSSSRYGERGECTWSVSLANGKLFIEEIGAGVFRAAGGVVFHK